MINIDIVIGGIKMSTRARRLLDIVEAGKITKQSDGTFLNEKTGLVWTAKDAPGKMSW